MRDSKQILKILFLCLLFTWFRATANRRVSTKFPTCVTEIFCVWVNTDKNYFLHQTAKTTISFVMSVCPSVRMDGISWNLSLEYFSNMSGKFKFRVNLIRIMALWYEDWRIFFINSRSNFLKIKMFSRNIVENIKNHIWWQKKSFFGKSWRLRDNVEKYCSPL
jgi:hypothetical protein